MGFKVKFGGEYTALRKIKLEVGTIEAGEAFYLVDAFMEGKGLFLGINTPLGIQEAGFIVPYRPKSRTELRKLVSSIAIPYIEGVKEIYVINQS